MAAFIDNEAYSTGRPAHESPVADPEESWLRFFELCRDLAASGAPLAEDERMADWIYLVPVGADRDALVIGAGWGFSAVGLAERCREVFVVDNSRDRLDHLSALAQARKLDRIRAIWLPVEDQLPVEEQSFDLVHLAPSYWPCSSRRATRNWLKSIFRLVQPGGTVHLSLPNRWAFPGLAARPKRSSAFSLSEYKQLLSQEGFSNISFFAPLPRFDGVPLIVLPLGESGAVEFFITKLVPLIESVSTEVKKREGFVLLAARLGLRVARLLPAERPLGLFTSGFTVIATKAGKNARAD